MYVCHICGLCCFSADASAKMHANQNHDEDSGHFLLFYTVSYIGFENIEVPQELHFCYGTCTKGAGDSQKKPKA